jgi:hypothetical protein
LACGAQAGGRIIVAGDARVHHAALEMLKIESARVNG